MSAIVFEDTHLTSL